MLLVTDKLDKNELKYDLLNEEKHDLSKDDRIEYVPIQHKASRLIYIILVGLALTAAAWLMFTTTKYSFNSHELDTRLMASTHKTLNETEIILSNVQDSVNLIRDDNTQIAVKYIEAIKELLQKRTRSGVNKINSIVGDKIREIENELTSFDYVITDASSGIVDYTLQDMKTLRDSIPSITNETYRNDLENVFETVGKQLTSAFEDLDEMYTFYGNYVGDIIQHKVQNATESISMIISSNRRQCECIIKEKINFCYAISAQNLKISKQLESLVKVFGIVNNTTDILDTLEPVMLKNTDQNTCNLLSEARLTLNKALEKSEALLESILKDDNCFLGSAVRKAAYKNHDIVKEYIQNNFATSIWSLSKSLDHTTANFKVVKESHRKKVEEDLNKGLEALTREILAKTQSLGKEAYNEYLTKSSFPDVRSWMDTKFQNVTYSVNPLFAKRQSDIADALNNNLQFVVFNQVPFISSLSVQNYLPNEVCPVSTDYQRFVSATLDGYLDSSHCKAREELAMSADLAKESEIAQSVLDGEEEDAQNEGTNKSGTGITVNDQKTTYDEIAQQFEKIIDQFVAENGEAPEIEVMVVQLPNEPDSQVENSNQTTNVTDSSTNTDYDQTVVDEIQKVVSMAEEYAKEKELEAKSEVEASKNIKPVSYEADEAKSNKPALKGANIQRK